MRLLYTTNDYDAFQAHRLRLVRAAGDAGYEVHVASPSVPEGFQTANGVQYHEIPLSRKGMQPWKEAGTVRALIRLYKQLRPAIVHHMTIKPVLYGSTAARLAKLPAIVNTVTGLGYAFTATGPGGMLLRSGVSLGYKIALNHPNQRIVFQNRDDRKRFLDAGWVQEKDTLVIRGSGVDIERFKPMPEPDEKPPLVVLPARLLWDKGIAEFNDAAGMLKEQGVQARFALVGDVDPGNPATIPKKRIQQWVQEGNLEWWGWSDDIQEVYKSAHVVCLPSHREGVPRVLLEAAACARPIITTDAPGCREAVVPGETGLMVPPQNPQALAEALKTLIEDKTMRREMGAKGRTRVENEFAEPLVIEKTLKTYASLL